MLRENRMRIGICGGQFKHRIAAVGAGRLNPMDKHCIVPAPRTQGTAGVAHMQALVSSMC